MNKLFSILLLVLFALPAAAAEQKSVSLQGIYWMSCERMGMTGVLGQISDDLAQNEDGDCGLVFTLRLYPDAQGVAFDALWSFLQVETGSFVTDFDKLGEGGEFSLQSAIASTEGGEPIPVPEGATSIVLGTTEDGLLTAQVPGVPLLIEQQPREVFTSQRPLPRPAIVSDG